MNKLIFLIIFSTCLCCNWEENDVKIVETISKTDSRIKVNNYYLNNFLVSKQTFCYDTMVEKIDYFENGKINLYSFYSNYGLSLVLLYDNNGKLLKSKGHYNSSFNFAIPKKKDSLTNILSSDTIRYYIFTPKIQPYYSFVFINYYDTLHNILQNINEVPGGFYTTCYPNFKKGINEVVYTQITLSTQSNYKIRKEYFIYTDQR
jgi:hypothetical protein